MFNSRLAQLVGALVVALTTACGGESGNGESLASDAEPGEPSLPAERVEGGVMITPDPQITDFSTTGWRTDFTRHTVPYSEIQRGGPPRDGIPPIDEPKFVSQQEADTFLAAEEPVAVVEVNGVARAYPLQIMLWHEIVNDEIAGEPIVVTYCPLCNTAIAFERTFEGQVLDFGTTGNLRFSDLVMYDRQTESWWQQITGEGIIGEHAGKQLEFVPTSILSYEDFKSSFPAGEVLSRDTGFDRDYGFTPYPGYDGGEPYFKVGVEDDRLRATERVVALELGGESAAYPFPILEKQLVVNDEVGDEPVVIFFKGGTRSALDQAALVESEDVGSGVVFSRELNGQLLTFRADRDHFIDDETGSRWNIAGQAVAGPLAGSRLVPIVHGNHFWFAWAVFRPDTRIYQ